MEREWNRAQVRRVYGNGGVELLEGFFDAVSRLTGQRHMNYFFNKGERLTVRIDGVYTGRELERLLEMLRILRLQDRDPSIVATELQLTTGVVEVRCLPRKETE
jgi:hypothetical protein